MGKGRRVMTVLLAGGALLGAGAPGASATIREGELIVGSNSGYTDNEGGISGLRLWRDDPPFISQSHAPAAGADLGFTGNRGMALEPTGDLVVSTFTEIHRVDNTTGASTLVSGPSRGTGPACELCVLWTVSPDGSIYVTDPLSRPEPGAPVDAAVLRIDPVTGDRTVVASGARGTGPSLTYPTGVELLDDGRLAVASSASPLGGARSILLVDPATGNRTATGPATSGPAYGSLARRDADSVYAMTGNVTDPGVLLLHDLGTGATTLVSGDGRGAGPAFGRFGWVEVGPDGTVYVTNADANAVMDVDPATGDRRVLTDDAAETNVDLGAPSSLVLAPESQEIRLPPVYATPGGEIDFTIPTIGSEIAPGQRALDAFVDEDAGLTVEPVPGGLRFRGTIAERGRRIARVDLSNRLITGTDVSVFIFVEDDGLGAEAAPGDVLATDVEFGDVFGQILAIDGTSGAAELITSAAAPPVEPGDPALVFPRALTIADDGSVYVVHSGAVLRVDPRTGRRTLVSGAGRGTGPAMRSPRDLILLPDGDLLVMDPIHVFIAGGAVGAIIRVDVETGDRTIAHDRGSGTGAPWCNAYFGARADDGSIDVYMDDNYPGEPTACPRSVVRVNLETGVRTLLSSSGRGAGPTLDFPVALNRTADGRLVASSSGGGLLAIDPATGDRTRVSDGGTTGGDAFGLGPVDDVPGGPLFLGGGGPRLLRQPTPGALLDVVANGETQAPGWVTLGDIAVVGDAPRCTDARVDLTRGTAADLDVTTQRGAPKRAGYPGMRATSVTALDPLPAGLALTDEGDAASVTGTPTAAGETTVRIRVENRLVSTTCTRTFAVAGPPEITSPRTLAGKAGEPLDYRVTFDAGFPTATTLTATGLPAGLRFDPATGVISGTPAAGTGGEYVVRLTATNSAGADAAELRLTIAETARVVIPVEIAAPPAAPPAAPAGAPAPAPVTPATCRSRRRVSINLMPPKGTALRRTVVQVNGRTVRTLGRGMTRLTLDFTGRPPSQVKVGLRATTTKGRVLVGQRTYRLCEFKGVGRVPLRPLKRPSRGR